MTYVVRRLLLMIPVIVGVTLLIFAVVQALPVSLRATMYITDPKELKPELIGKIIEEYGLNKPVYIQYYIWIKQLIMQRHLGVDRNADLVFNAIMQRLPATVEIVMYAIPPIIIIGILLGVLSATHKDKVVDHASRLLAIMGTSLPSFFLGIVLLSIFYAGLGWFPPGRMGNDVNLFITAPNTSWHWYTHLITIDALLNGQFWIFLDGIRHLVLPVTVLTLINTALIVRVMRSSMLEVLSKDYITAAKAKGLTQREVVNKHARRNALIPTITISGLLAAALLTGVTITETVFNMGGIGQYAAESARAIDIPPVLGYALLSAIVFVVANLIVDILYAYIDPRIRLG